MSTRITAGVEENGKVRAIGIHWDHATAFVLVNFYRTQKRASKLMDLGYCSSIGPSLAKPKGFKWAESGMLTKGDYLDPELDTYCIAHHRDWHRDLEILNYDSIEEFIEADTYGSYVNFLFTKNKWYFVVDGKLEPLENYLDLFREHPVL